MTKFRFNTENANLSRIIDSLQKNSYYCPCSIIKDDDHKCPCKDWLSSDDSERTCHCKMYTKD